MDIDVRDTGPAPIIAALGRELGIVEAINELLSGMKNSDSLTPEPIHWL